MAAAFGELGVDVGFGGDGHIERLNLTTVWAQQSASVEDLSKVADKLLLAMHDLRSVLVRKKAQQVEKTDVE